MLRALAGGVAEEPQTGSRGQARLPAGARAQGAVALDLDDPQRQPSAAEPRRAQGRRPPGVERLGRDPDDGALFRRAAAAGPGRGQAARLPGVPRASSTCSAIRAATSSSGFAPMAARNPIRREPRTATSVDFSTGSVGLGVGMTLFASLAQDYLRLKGLRADRCAARTHDRARRRRRTRRGQHLRGAARRLEARRPQSLVDHRLQPPEPRRGRVRPAFRPHRRAVRNDGLARRHPQIRPAARGGLCPTRRPSSARMDRRLPEFALFGAGLQGRRGLARASAARPQPLSRHPRDPRRA